MTRPTLNQTIDHLRAAVAMAWAPPNLREGLARAVQREVLVSKFDMLGLSPDEKERAIDGAYWLAAAGASRTPDLALIDVFAKIAAKGTVDNLDLGALDRAGISIRIRPETLAACEREARES